MPRYSKQDYIATLQRMISRIENVIEEINSGDGTPPSTVAILQIVPRAKHNERCKQTYKRLKEDILKKKKDKYHADDGKEKDAKRSYYERNREKILEQKKVAYREKQIANQKAKEVETKGEQKGDNETEN